jgi:hypothetical protein
MAADTTTPVKTPTEAPTTIPEPGPQLWPAEICTQQKRELASPDVSP